MNIPRVYFIALVLGLFALLGITLFSITQGAVKIPFEHVLAALNLSTLAVPEMTELIIYDLRLPRSLLAICTGAGLAMVGVLLQTTTRNELADPFLFGLSAGASAGAVFVMTRLGDQLGIWTLPVAAFCGGILSAISVLVLFSLQSARGVDRLVISGLAISFLFGAVTSYLVYSGDQRAASSVLFWSMGGLGLARWENLPFALAAVVILVALISLRWRSLDALLAGDQTANSLGINVSRLRIQVFLCCAIATALLVALTGVIGFVGLMVPHLARPISGVSHRLLAPMAMLIGALIMTSGDLLSRTLLAPQELPIGIITAALGGIFVLVLVLKK